MKGSMEWTIIQVPYSTDTADDLVKSKGPDWIVSRLGVPISKKITNQPPNIAGWVALSRDDRSFGRPTPLDCRRMHGCSRGGGMVATLC